MEPIDQALELLKRQAELEAGLRQAGGIRITEERKFYALRDHLQRCPQAGATLFDLGGLQAELEDLLRVPVDLVTPADLPAKIRRQVLAEALPV